MIRPEVVIIDDTGRLRATRGPWPERTLFLLSSTVTTIYRWKSKFAGMNISGAKRLRYLEEENRRLEQMVADQALHLKALRSVLKGNW